MRATHPDPRSDRVNDPIGFERVYNRWMNLARPLRSVGRRRRPVVELSDIELLGLVAEGSEAAFEALWRRYGGAVLGVCRAILRDPEAAEDATQETFARVWRSAGTYDARKGRPTAWLLTVARHSAINIARVTRPEPVRQTGDEPGPAREQEIVDRLWLHGALSRLPDREREVVGLAYFAELSHSQIAVRIDQPLGTVKSRIRRALERLAEMAEER